MPARRQVKPGIFTIVGIGASAGGIEAVSRLLRHLPVDTGMAFVVVQHLAPERESVLPAILQKSSSIPVAQADDGMTIERDRVYVIPPGTHMSVIGNALHLIPRPAGVHALAVNAFLASLAAARGPQAIAVILSGTASDGALGVKAVKAEGGLVFAQDPATAAHDGMPRNALATGAVDFVMTPEEIAAELARLARVPSADADGAKVFDDAGSMTAILEAVRDATGVDFTLYKINTVRRRLMRRLLVNKTRTLREYLAQLRTKPGEAKALHDDLLIHVTHFYREPKCLASARAKAFPRALKALPPREPFRVWVAGCSTGEEAYSLAIELFEFLDDRGGDHQIQIFATDISEASLERARAGRYPEEIHDFVPKRILRRYFTKTDSGYQIAPRVREVCVFAKHDLTKDPPFANLDLISCCNVLIYLSPAAQRGIFPLFHYALRPSGSLLLGTSETVGDFGALFAQSDRSCRLYHKKPTLSRLPKAARPPYRAAASGRAAPAPRETHAGWPETDVQRAVDRILLTRFAPAGVVVDGDLSILQFRGRVTRFLEPGAGKASLSLKRMLPPHTAAELAKLVLRARRNEAAVRKSGLAAGTEDARELMTLEVIPFRLPISKEPFFIVLFEEDGAARARPSKAAEGGKRGESAKLRRLRAEVSSTRAYLQNASEEHEAANEELKAANEENISSNEELQSTNEELEIAKEELQAANEELSTVNDELQSRNGELIQTNDDLLNLISSVHLPIVMVKADLRIRRFTSMAEKLMNLIPTDVGRPIGDVKPKLALPNIEEIIAEVIDTVQTKELEVRDAEGRSYSLRVRPYRTSENRIEGAVLVFVDNDPIRRSVPVVIDASAFEAALDIVREPLALLDAQLRIRAASRSMYQAFGLTTNQFGRSILEVANGFWDMPELRMRLLLLAEKGEPFSTLQLKAGTRSLSFSGRRVETKANGEPMLLLAIDERA